MNVIEDDSVFILYTTKREDNCQNGQALPKWVLSFSGSHIMRKWFFLLIVCLCPNTFANEITVSVAASLRNVFEALIAQYTAQKPDQVIYLNSAGSGTLLQQIRQGAPVDVFASADLHTMRQAQAEGLLANNTFILFAGNDLVLATAKKHPFYITQAEDLKHKKINRIALGNPKSVPAGRYAIMALQQADIVDDLTDKIIRTRDVRQALDYIVRGEVDVAFVYRTDVQLMADKVNIAYTFRLPENVQYPIAILQDSQERLAARNFVDFIHSPTGRDILQKQGFRLPELPNGK